MQTSRRGFLKGLFTAVAVVAIEVKLSQPSPVPTQPRLTWAEANDRYDYGINKLDPLDVVIYDKHREMELTPKELMHTWCKLVSEHDDVLSEAYEATAIIAMTQGKLLHDIGMDRYVLAPEQAFHSTLDPDDDDELDAAKCTCVKFKSSDVNCPLHGDRLDAGLPYILMAVPA